MNSASTENGLHPNPGLVLCTRMSVNRILAVDAFRGITFLIMIFVNALAGVRGMPGWLEHMPEGVDGMTFVDVVFPAFMFIAGMSIPFAIAHRLSKGDSPLQLQRHILVRALGLLVLGVFMVNAEDGYNERAMHMSIHLWALLFYAAAILVWSVYRFKNDTLSNGMRIAGIIGLLVLAWIFRGGKSGTDYISPQWWGILGLIGWAYLIVSIIYQLSKGHLLALLAALGICVAYYCVGHLDAIKDSAALQFLLSQFDAASDSAIVLCGLISSLIFFDDNHRKSNQRRFTEALAFALVLLVVGYLLRPYFNISKNDATPTWCLYSSAICIVLFALLYWLIDLKKIQGWTAFFRVAGANSLLTYIIPYIVYELMQYLNLSLPDALHHGLPGLLWCAGYAVAVLALVNGLSRLNIKLQL
jgi:heparan-alpha-glucosaminide N-acetyltransferase